MDLIGRNDPCPCGSGLKYKNCCLSKKAITSADYLWHKLRDVDNKLVKELMEHLGHFYCEDMIVDAWTEFMFDENDDFDEESPHNQAFFPWLLYDYMPDDDYLVEKTSKKYFRNHTIAQSYLSMHKDRLADLKVRFIEATGCQPYSFYEVLECEGGKGFRLRDIFLGNEMYVSEKLGSQGTQRGDILFARVVRIDHIYMLVGCGGIYFQPGNKIHIIELRVAMRSKSNVLNVDDLFDWEEEIRMLYLDLYTAHITPPTMVNTDGEPLCSHELYFEIESTQEAFDKLKSLALIQDEKELLRNAEFDNEGRLQCVELPWLKRGNRSIKGWDNTVLGHVIIEGKQIRVTVNSKKRAERIKKKINTLLKGHVKYRTTKIQSIESMMNKVRKEPDSRNDEERKYIQIQPEYKEVIDAELKKHWDQWITDRLIALGNKTPVEAVKDPDGREMVIALLDDFERHDEIQPIGMRQKKFIDRAREQLGLS